MRSRTTALIVRGGAHGELVSSALRRVSVACIFGVQLNLAFTSRTDHNGREVSLMERRRPVAAGRAVTVHLRAQTWTRVRSGADDGRQQPF
jgi:hypothetical protein